MRCNQERFTHRLWFDWCFPAAVNLVKWTDRVFCLRDAI